MAGQPPRHASPELKTAYSADKVHSGAKIGLDSNLNESLFGKASAGQRLSPPDVREMRWTQDAKSLFWVGTGVGSRHVPPIPARSLPAVRRELRDSGTHISIHGQLLDQCTIRSSQRTKHTIDLGKRFSIMVSNEPNAIVLGPVFELSIQTEGMCLTTNSQQAIRPHRYANSGKCFVRSMCKIEGQ